MKNLPIGIQDFRKLQIKGYIYVDKTAHLLNLIRTGRRYFFSRPRRFGKSLTISTLEAMFRGEHELFEGLAAEDWVKEQAEHPSPVLHLDMSMLGYYETAEKFENALYVHVKHALPSDVSSIPYEVNVGLYLGNVLKTLYEAHGMVVLLIDEYDTPILHNLNDSEKLEKIRKIMQSFYSVIKGSDKYLSFVFITGISKFSKMGVYSSMNNLFDISMHEQYGTMLGFTQEEIEKFFSPYIEKTSKKLSMKPSELLFSLKRYYDGYSFDGVHRVYNPFSLVNFFAVEKFNAFWYESGSPTFLYEWLKSHGIDDIERFRDVHVVNDFTSTREIEKASVESFLFQSGYLTIVDKGDLSFTLDYPNQEVLIAMSQLYLECTYHMERYFLLGRDLWHAIYNGDIAEIVRLYNQALSTIPYDDFSNRNEYWYRSLFIMFLYSLNTIIFAEVHTSKDRSDVCIMLENCASVFEFKFAKQSCDVEKAFSEGIKQIQEKEYAKSYDIENYTVTEVVFVIDDEKRLMHAQEVKNT